MEPHSRLPFPPAPHTLPLRQHHTPPASLANTLLVQLESSPKPRQREKTTNELTTTATRPDVDEVILEPYYTTPMCDDSDDGKLDKDKKMGR